MTMYTGHCSSCGDYREIEYVNRSISEAKVCEDCMPAYHACDICEDAIGHEDDMATYQDKHVCENCLKEHFKKCDYCGELYDNEEQPDEVKQDAAGDLVCSSCRENECGSFEDERIDVEYERRRDMMITGEW